MGSELVYVPKIKQYRVNFDRQNSKFTSACASAEFVDIHFNYLYAANVGWINLGGGAPANADPTQCGISAFRVELANGSSMGRCKR